MNNFDGGVETSYNVKFKNCERDDYQMMYNDSVVLVSDTVKNTNDTTIATKLCPTLAGQRELFQNLYL